MRRLALLLAAALLAPAAGADAAFVTYTETATASGSLGNVAFANALLTLTQTADTSRIILANGFYSVAAATSTLSVAGLGTASFTTPTFVGSQPGTTYAGLGAGTAGTSGPSVLSIINPAFSTYNLATSIGPLAGAAVINPTINFATSAGSFAITAVSGNATFQANVGAVPEPASALMLAIGATGAGVVVRGRARRGDA